jgi:hypothetical protein
MFGWRQLVNDTNKFEKRICELSKHNPDIPYELIREVALELARKSPRPVLDIPEYEILYEAIKRQTVI